MRNDEPAEVLGHTKPRLWTPELRELTPETSFGYDLIDFARDVCGTPFDPYQEWLAIHVGELLPDGRPRFRYVLILIARQNGKTLFAKVLTLYWLFVERTPLILGSSTDRSYAKRTWTQVIEMARDNEWLAPGLGPKSIRLTIGEESLVTNDGAEYTFAANNGRAGRSMTLHRWICDELREHHTRDAWDSATNAMNAVADAQVIAITNQGDDSSIVLDALRTPALEYIETGFGDARLGLFEWSAPPGSEVDDVEALRTSNPNAGRPGHGPDLDALMGAARRAKSAGGIELAGFRTEVLCQRVALLDPAVDPDLWADAAGEPADLATHRDKVALCLDVSLDGSHASLIAAAVIGDQVHVDVVKAWSGFGCTKALREELPAIVAKVKPRAVGWFPSGPAAVITADMLERRRAGWPPKRVELVELKAETAAVCMALPELVKTGEIVHGGDPMLNAHIASAQKLRRGDGWVFTRRGTGPVDGVYALAGAVHLARTLPPPRTPLTAL